MVEHLDRLKAALADRYEIQIQIGSGGMATVYLARDLKHERQVAVKVLRPDLTESLGDRRFQQEIKLAARLNHPHILALHDSGESDGFLYFVMPFVEGESLRDRIAREGQLPVDEAVRITRDVATALNYAHAQGVIHRDIKPENILLHEGEAIVADFGIARAMTAVGQERLTGRGLSVGTPAYMSPEQTSGEHVVDGRSDIYSLATVAYEMLIGEAPYTGPSVQTVLARKLTEPVPALRNVREAVPEEVEAAIMRALARTPADRFSTAGQFSDALVAPRPPAAAPAGPRRLSPLRIGILAAGAVTAVGLGLGLTVGRPGVPPPVPATHTQLTFTGDVIDVAMTPDETFLAYLSKDADGYHVFVRETRGSSPIELASSPRFACCLAWSPDGTELLASLALESGTGTYLFPRLGGTPRHLLRALNAGWSPDGSEVSGHGLDLLRIFIANTSTGARRSVDVQDSLQWLMGIDWSPSGAFHLALTNDAESGKSRLWTIRESDGAHHLVLEDSARLSSPRWSRGGEAIYYLRPTGQVHDLWKIAIAGDRGEPIGSPIRVLGGLEVMQEGLGGIVRLSPDATSLVYSQGKGYSNLWSVPFPQGTDAPATPVRLTQGTLVNQRPVVSPDGESVAFVSTRSGALNVFIMPVGRREGSQRQVTFVDSVIGTPVWSPDGESIAVGAHEDGQNTVWVFPASGGTGRRFERTRLSPSGGLAWAPGSRILYQRPGNQDFHFLDPLTGDEKPMLGPDSAGTGWAFQPMYSPLATHVALRWNRSRSRGEGVYLLALETGALHRIAPGRAPLGWSSGGDSVYVMELNGRDVELVALGGGEPERIVTFPFDINPRNVSLLPDRQGLVASVEESVSDAWLIENFDPEVTASSD